MKYKEKEIGIPTVEMFDEYIKHKGFLMKAADVYEYCKKKKWLTKRGTPMESVEVMTNVYNGFFMQASRKGVLDKQGIRRYQRDKSWLAQLYKNVDNFIADCLPEEVIEYHDAIVGFKTLLHKHMAK